MILRAVQLVCLSISLLPGISCDSINVVKVEGRAMLPAYKDGDRVVVKKDLDQIVRSDVIIFRYPMDTSKTYIKRVIGLPGETVSITKGKVMINGNELAEPYVDPAYNRSGFDLPPFKILPDNYFVMGDNRDSSSDSRYWGTVAKELIEGKCFLSY
jgi:signal peptidase I